MPTARIADSAALLVALALHLSAAAQDRSAPPPVVVATVEARTVNFTRLFVGDVRASREVLVGAEADGSVVAFPADEGQRVESGALLAKLRTTSVELDLAAAKATLRSLEATLLELQNGPRAEEIAQARARLEVADAELAYRDWALQNAEDLLRSGTSSEDEVREARRQALRAQGEHSEAKQALDLLLAGTREEELARAEADVAAQRARTERLEDELGRHEVRAPFTGYVVAEATEVGAWLSRGSPVVRIAELDAIDVVLPVPERDVAAARVGAKIDVEVPALPSRTFHGTIFSITPSADLRARTIPVRVRIENVIEDDRPLLMAGMFAQARMPVGEPVEALLVPTDALVLGGPQEVIQVVDHPDDGPATVRPVTVRTQTVDGERIAVEGEGLKAGDLVVVEGNERLRPGQPVQIKGHRD